MALHPGTALLHYRILEKIGQGGMGEAYKAEDLKLGRVVAIKVLSPDAREDERARRRLLQEAHPASALNHPNIVTIHAIEESLAARLQRGPLDLGQVLDLGIQVADALTLAHASDLIHRDIKSSNILLTPRGRAKLVEFGLAKVTRPVAAFDTLTMGLTGPGTILGTAGYMSPEQTRGEPLDARSDLFSLECVLYEAITGTLSFRGVLHFFQSEYESAEVIEREAVSLASKARDGLYLAQSLFYLGLSRANLGRISEALAALHEALDMTRRNGNQIVLSRVPNGLGWVYREIEDLGRAIEYNEACVETARRTRTAEAEANALINLVYDYTQAGNLSRAWESIDAVEAIFDRDPWNRWRFFDVRHQAGASEFWLAGGRLDHAEEHARRLFAAAARGAFAQSAAVLRSIAGSVADEALRANFLNTRAIRAVLQGAEGG